MTFSLRLGGAWGRGGGGDEKSTIYSQQIWLRSKSLLGFSSVQFSRSVVTQLWNDLSPLPVTFPPGPGSLSEFHSTLLWQVPSMSARGRDAPQEQTVQENRGRTLPRARLATLLEPQPGRPHCRRFPQPAAVTGFTTATLPQARMDSAGSGNVTYQRTLLAGGKQGGKRKRAVGGNHHLINNTKYPRVEVDHKTLDSKVNGTEWKNKTHSE